MKIWFFLIYILKSFFLSAKAFREMEIEITKTIKSITEDVLFLSEGIIRDECYNTIREYLNQNDTAFLFKLFMDSSKNRYDLGSYTDCLNVDYQGNFNDTQLNLYDFSLIQRRAIFVLNRTDIRYEKYNFLVGMCFIKACDNIDLKNIFQITNKRIGSPVVLDSKHLEVYTVKDTPIESKSFYYNLLPFYLFSLQIIFVVFNFIPHFLIGLCIRKRNNVKITSQTKDYVNDTYESYSNDQIDLIRESSLTYDPDLQYKTRVLQYSGCFAFSQNIEDLSSKNSKVNREYGVSYLRGFRVMSMLFMLIGCLFVTLFNSPLKIYCNYHFSELLKSLKYIIIFCGIRYSPRVLLACSGLIHVYKMLCYLDDRSKKRYEDEHVETSITVFDHPLDKIPEELVFGISTKETNSFLRFSDFVVFITKQTYKFFLFAMSVLYFQFSYFYIPKIFMSTGPMWEYFKTYFLDSNCLCNLYSTILLYNVYLEDQTRVNLYWIIINEITFFLVFSILIYLCYKYSIRMDLIFCFLFFGLIVIKFLLFQKYPNYYTTLYYFNDESGIYFTSPVNNASYYLIGIFFGKINYIIQKQLTKEDISENKRFLLLNHYFLRIFKRDRNIKVILYSLVGVFFAFLLVISYPLFVHILRVVEEDPSLETVNTNYLVNLFYLFDTEVMVYIVISMVVLFYLTGDSWVIQKFSHEKWIPISRSYYSFLLAMSPIIIAVLYLGDTRIKLHFFNVIIYSSSSFIIVMIISFIMVLTVENPLKRLNKLLIREFEGSRNN